MRRGIMAMHKINKSVLLKTLFLIIILAAICTTGYYLSIKRVQKNESLLDRIVEKSQKNTQNVAELQKNQTSLKKEIQQLKSLNSSVNRQLNEIKRSAAKKKPVDIKWLRNTDNGHIYGLTPYAMPWQTAENFAKTLGGHIVAINNADENAFLVEAFGGQVEYWTGLTDIEEEGKWKWTTGEKIIFTNWAPKEPDNYKQMQHSVIINKQLTRSAGNSAGFWNDVSGNDIHIAIVEIVR